MGSEDLSCPLGYVKWASHLHSLCLSLLGYMMEMVMQHLSQRFMARVHKFFFCITLTLFKILNYIMCDYICSYISLFKNFTYYRLANVVLTMTLTAFPSGSCCHQSPSRPFDMHFADTCCIGSYEIVL